MTRILYKIILLLPLTLVPALLHADVIITEVMYDLPDADEGREWIEVQNTGPARDLGSWKFSENGTDHNITFVSGGSISGSGAMTTGEYAIIADDAAAFLADWPDYSGKLFDSSFSLSNSGETLLMKYSSELLVTDEVTYDSSTGAAGDGNSLQLQEDDSWIAATSTPGAVSLSDNEVEETLPTVSISGTISSDTIWSSENGVYILENAVTVSASTTLTVEAGTIIKARHGGAGTLEVLGTLSAIGTEENPIYFTSLLDDSVGGDSDGTGSTTGAMKDWVGIYFKPGSTGNIDHAVIRYAGYIGIGSNSGIDNEGGTIEINNSHIRDNYLRGIFSHESGSVTINNSIIESHEYGVTADSGEINIQNSEIKNNTQYGLDFWGSEMVTLIDNIFSGNQKLGRVNASADFTHSGNASSDIANRGFERAGTIARDTVWDTGGLPFIIPASNTVWVGASSTLTISPGSIVKFGASAGMIVEGNLDIAGTEGSEIYLTSLKDDSIGGDTNGGASSTPNLMDWNGVEFWDGSAGEISHTVIRYTGGVGPSGNGTRSAIYNLGGGVLLNNIAFSDNFNNDIYQTTGSTTISHSTFTTGSSLPVLNNVGMSTLDARLNWWGTATGPTHSSNATGTGPVVSDNVLFDPWIRRDPALPNPVIIVPGIMGSRLNSSTNSEVWPAGLLLLLPLDLHLNQLSLSENGSDLSGMQVGSLIDSISDTDFFLGLISKLELEGYQQDIDLFTFPYDWRLDVKEISSLLKQKIEEIKLETGAEEIDIVAHSMGGLVTKDYLNTHSDNGINKFIDLGTPHTGSPKAFKILNYGDNLDATFFFSLLGLNSERVKIITQNMPAVYQLLPSENYFDDSDPNYQYYVFNGVNGNDRLTFEQTAEYMKDEGRNGLLVDRANEFHQEIDGLDPADYGVETYNIVGCGTPTIGQFYVLGKEGDKYIYNIKMINGDGTVPLKSAEAMSADQTYYVKNANHAVMPSTSGVKELVTSILTGDDFSISSHSNLATNSNGCQIPNGRLVSFHSPVELHIYDGLGNHVGPDENGDIENEIEGVVYEVIDDNKFAYLPDGIEYTVKGSATDAGTFDTRIQEIVDGEVATTTLFVDMPLTLNTNVNFDLGSDIPDQIYLDHDGDEVFESSQDISTTTAGLLESTGKTAEVSIPESEPVSSPKAQFIKNEEVADVATSSDVIATLPVSLPQEQVHGASITQSNSPQTISEEQEVKIEKEETKYDNTAVVYKSFGYKIISVFKSIWAWIISKL